jgi:hypothetical protein
MTDLTMKGTKGRDCSPRYHQGKAVLKVAEPPQNVHLTDAGTPMGGVPPEAKGTGQGAGGVIDPGMFNVDGHAVRVFSRYWEGKRSGPDWLHKRVEAAEQKRWDSVSDPFLSQSLPRRKRL